jgi:hypothetical protein
MSAYVNGRGVETTPRISLLGKARLLVFFVILYGLSRQARVKVFCVYNLEGVFVFDACCKPFP